MKKYPPLTQEERYHNSFHGQSQWDHHRNGGGRLWQLFHDFSRYDKPNTGGNAYRSKQADEWTNRLLLHKFKPVKGTKVIEEDELAKRQKKWRPEPIEGWTKKACLPMVRAERIDRLVYAHQKAGGNRYQPLPWHGKSVEKVWIARIVLGLSAIE